MTDTTIPVKLSASGKVIVVKDGFVVFNPAGTSYELQLVAAKYAGPINKPIKAIISVTARKVYTVPSGGNFIVPIFGPVRIIQGRVLSADDRSLVVHAGCPIHVDLPTLDSAIDLNTGSITVGGMVNVACLPGARIEIVP